MTGCLFFPKENNAGSALKEREGPYSVGSITEPNGDECLNCTLIGTFSSYLKAASDLSSDIIGNELHKKLKDIRQRVEDLNITICSNNVTNTSKVVFQKDEKRYNKLEKVRSILALFVKWIVKDNC